jgi:hypothetical protein
MALATGIVPCLQSLDLSRNAGGRSKEQITRATVAPAAAALGYALGSGDLPVLAHLILDFDDNGLDGNDAAAIFAGLRGVPRLSKLSMIGNRMGTSKSGSTLDLPDLWEPLQYVPQLTHLSLSSNGMRCKDFVPLARGLRYVRHLELLTIDGDWLDSDQGSK